MRGSLGQSFRSIPPATRWILLASVLVSVVFFVLPASKQLELGLLLVATPDSIWHKFQFWQFVTSPFLEISFISLLFQSFMIYSMVPPLERWWGTTRFLRFFAMTSLVGVLVGTLVGLVVPSPASAVLAGLDPFLFASLVAFGVLYARQPVKFWGAVTMTGKQLAIGICAFTLVLAVFTERWAEGAAQASAMLLALGITSGRLRPKLWWLKWKQHRVRSKFQVMDGGKDSSPSGSKGKEPKRWVN